MSINTVAAIARPDAAKPARTKHGFANNDEWRRLYFQSRRIAELHRLFRQRYGAEFYIFPDDDSGWEDLLILLHHYCVCDPGRVPVVIKTRAPWIVGTQQEDILYAQVAKSADAKLPTAAELAEVMNLAEADRVRLAIRTIGAVDVTPPQRKDKKKAGDRARKDKKRRAAGKQTREQYLSGAKTRTKPWDIKGISRATWYRQQRETGCSAVSKNSLSYNTADALVSLATSGTDRVAGKTPDRENVLIFSPATARRGSGQRRKSGKRRQSQTPGQRRTSVRKKAA
jgi:hypothetical protein